MKKLQYTLLAVVAAIAFTSCEKVSPIGVLVSGTGVEDRVKMSNKYYSEHKSDFKWHDVVGQDEYTFLVGADSHLTTDDGRMREMFHFWKIKYLSVSLRSAIAPKRPTISVKVLINN